MARRALGLAGVHRGPRLALPALVFAALTTLVHGVLPRPSYWYTGYEETAGAQDDYVPVDTELTYYRQPVLLEEALSALAPQRPGVADVYFVGFASDSSQNVFMKEVARVRDVTLSHFPTAAGGINLVNNPRTVERLPLANPSNLARALTAIGRHMDVKEDVLFLYLTSHGSRDAELTVRFPEIAPNPLSAQGLRQVLDDSGIRWRIVVVSACFSGSFIDALATPHTLVLTASHAENTSFGCSNDRELTYFGEHMFHQELASGAPLLEAFERARRSLRTREEAEGHVFSDPQQFMGEAMAAKLTSIENP